MPLSSFLIGCVVYRVCSLVTEPPAIPVIARQMFLSISSKFDRGSKRTNDQGVCEGCEEGKNFSSTHIDPEEVTTTYCSARKQTRPNWISRIDKPSAVPNGAKGSINKRDARIVFQLKLLIV